MQEVRGGVTVVNTGMYVVSVCCVCGKCDVSMQFQCVVCECMGGCIEVYIGYISVSFCEVLVSGMMCGYVCNSFGVGWLVFIYF